MDQLPDIVPIERRSLHDDLVASLRQLIARGVLAPGSKLNEKDLCASFNVSRTPLREAIRALAAEGLVVVTPHRGASVATVSEDQILESFVVMGALEGLAGELAAPRISEPQLAAIRADHAAMLDCRAAGDLDGYYAHNRRIHDAIFEAADNATLNSTRQLIFTRIVNLRFIARIGDDEWSTAIAEHEEMLEALAERDGAKLGAVLRRHLDSKRRQVAHWLARQPLPDQDP
ncbi:GntR family transcriptional regulator [Cereibacter changlensis JA139]|uniref:GntR family transcriptional regulator n=2 Tax=Cereibacter changlensis TaxID=402884 RepID=A0A2T4JV86_9RHOB|nr:GntR family transcriptional regulator [Cereibacter changlensis]PTE21831.1 GntR family transcriptional regulator [Cereibacter changlensis JA139]PZX48472.1 DNA-binding GntR family transcriptional regulator [Cereibacter changlensis]